MEFAINATTLNAFLGVIDNMDNNCPRKIDLLVTCNLKNCPHSHRTLPEGERKCDCMYPVR